MTVEYWRGILSDVVARLVALPARALVGLGAADPRAMRRAVVALPHRAETDGAAERAPASQACRWKPCVGACRCSLPVVIWMAIARTVGVAERPAWLLAAALGLLPLAGFLLHLSALLFAGASEPGATRRRLHSLARWAVLAAVTAAALGLVVRSVPVLPSVADLIDRAGFGGLLLTAVATWLLRQDLLYSVRDKIATSRTGRLVAAATHAVPGLMVVAAVSGLAGWINFGWALARAVAFFVLATGLALLLCSVLRDLASALERRFASSADKGAPGATEMIEAGYRLAVIAVVVGAAWLLASYYLRSTTATAAFWIFTVAGGAAVRLAARPDLGGIGSAHRPRTASGRLDQHPGDLRRSRHPRLAGHRDRAGAGLGPRFRSGRPRDQRHPVDPDRAGRVQHRGRRAGGGLRMASRQDRDRQPAADDGGARSDRDRRGAPPRAAADAAADPAQCAAHSHRRSPPC